MSNMSSTITMASIMAQGNDAETGKSFAKSRKRISGIKKAVDRLTK